MKEIWLVAGGGAAGATLCYLAITVIGARFGLRRVGSTLVMFGCLGVGVEIAASRQGATSAFGGVGFLGAVAPFSVIYLQYYLAKSLRVFEVLPAAAWLVMEGAAMSILGYISMDVAYKLVEKLPSEFVP